MEFSNYGPDIFWINKPCALLESIQILPLPQMTLNQKLNALSRLIFIVALIAYLASSYIPKIPLYIIILVIGLAIVIAIGATSGNSEGFTMPPTYAEGACPSSTVPPLFTEEWQIPPPSYDIRDGPSYEMIGEPEIKDWVPPMDFQYLTASNIESLHGGDIMNLPLEDAKLYVNDAFIKDTTDWRNDMTRIYLNKLQREYRNGPCYDEVSPFTSC